MYKIAFLNDDTEYSKDFFRWNIYLSNLQNIYKTKKNKDIGIFLKMLCHLLSALVI